MKCNYKRNVKNIEKPELTEEQIKLVSFYEKMYSVLLRSYYDEKNKSLKNEEEFFNTFYDLLADENFERQEIGMEQFLILEQTGKYEAIFYEEMSPEPTRIVSKNAKELIGMGARIFCAINFEFFCENGLI